MECRELIAFAIDDRIGVLRDAAGPERRELAEHLETCAACRAELEKIDAAWSLLGEDPDLPVSPDFRRRTLALIDDEMLRMRLKEFSARPRRRFVRPLAEAAAVVIAALGGWWAAHRLPRRRARRVPQRHPSPTRRRSRRPACFRTSRTVPPIGRGGSA